MWPCGRLHARPRLIATAFQEYLAAREKRRKRSLQSCHRFSLYERPRHAKPKDTGAFVPQASAGIENDRNLTDGARRCARKIMELAYRSNRGSRSARCDRDVSRQSARKVAAGRCSAICASSSGKAMCRWRLSRPNGRGCAAGWWSSCWRRCFRAITGKNGRKSPEIQMRHKSHRMRVNILK